MNKIALVSLLMMLLILCCTASIGCYTLGYLTARGMGGEMPDEMWMTHFAPNFTLGAALVIGGLYAKYSDETDKIEAKSKIAIVAGLLFVCSIIFMMLIVRWAGISLY
ncbi:MAG: hypothetical protein NTY09_15140 [bacterium]|nr:hypothetical protein [bacterium]